MGYMRRLSLVTLFVLSYLSPQSTAWGLCNETLVHVPKTGRAAFPRHHGAQQDVVIVTHNDLNDGARQINLPAAVDPNNSKNKKAYRSLLKNPRAFEDLLTQSYKNILKQGSRLTINGQIIATGTGYARLEFDTTSTTKITTEIEVYPNTVLWIKPENCTSHGMTRTSIFELDRGSLIIRHIPKDNCLTADENLSPQCTPIKTPDGCVTPLGTSFELDVSDNETKVTVSAGVAEFEASHEDGSDMSTNKMRATDHTRGGDNNPNSQSVYIPAGWMSEAKPEGTPSVPEPADPRHSLIIDWTYYPQYSGFAREFPTQEWQERITNSDTPAIKKLNHAWKELVEDGPNDAFHEAVEAIKLDPSLTEANIVQGLALLKLGKPVAAEAKFEAIIDSSAAADRDYQYLAWSWLAVSLLAQSPVSSTSDAANLAPKKQEKGQVNQNIVDRTIDAAQHAYKMRPESPVVLMNYAQVLFYLYHTQEAEQAAQEALQLKPAPLEARLTLTQILLERATTTDSQAQAVSDLAQARGQIQAAKDRLTLLKQLLRISKMSADVYGMDYQDLDIRTKFLSVFIDYIQSMQTNQDVLSNLAPTNKAAERIDTDLHRILRQAPYYLPAIRLLARLYLDRHDNQAAERLLREQLVHHPDSPQLRAALASVYYEENRKEINGYASGETDGSINGDINLNQSNGLYLAALSRALLDNNRLSDAIKIGQEAVQFAPELGQTHAVLGLAYDFSGLKVRAEREYRAALALDPSNALARIELALRGATPELRVGSVTQAFLFDPTVSDQLFRGGISTDVTFGGGDGNLSDLEISTRNMPREKQANLFGFLSYAQDQVSAETSGFTGITDRNNYNVAAYTTYAPDQNSNLLANFDISHTHSSPPSESMPLQTIAPLPTDESDNAFQIAGRHDMHFGHAKQYTHALWWGVSYLSYHSKDERLGSVSPPLTPANYDYDQWFLATEARLDISLNKKNSSPSLLTLGLGYTPRSYQNSTLFPTTIPPLIQNYRSNGSIMSGYAQWTALLGHGRLPIIAQIKQEQYDQAISDTSTASATNPAFMHHFDTTQAPTDFNLLATYNPFGHTLTRLFLNRQAQHTGLATDTLGGLVAAADSTRTFFGATPFALRPNEALLAEEPTVVPQGFPSSTTTVELDLEQRLHNNGLLKLFGFFTSADNLVVGTAGTFQANRGGAGIRFETQVSRAIFFSLFGVAAHTWHSNSGDSLGAVAGSDTVPFQPDYQAELALNWVDPNSGTKIYLDARYVSSFALPPSAASRIPQPDFAARTYVDLFLAYEPTLRQEFFIQVFNLLDSAQIDPDGFPVGGRRIEFGYTIRF